MSDRPNQLLTMIGRSLQKQKLDGEWQGIEVDTLAKMSDKELAKWQAEHPDESAHFILAQYEWSRRLTMQQVRATRWAAWMGLVGVIIGVILTVVAQRLGR